MALSKKFGILLEEVNLPDKMEQIGLRKLSVVRCKLNRTAEKLKLLITTYLESEYVERIQAVSNQVEVINKPEWLPAPRYKNDHYSEINPRTVEMEKEWHTLLKSADILFDFDRTNLESLPELLQSTKWIQGSSAGIGQMMEKYGFNESLANIKITTASGIHKKPLAEFVLMGILMHYRGFDKIQQFRRDRIWDRYSTDDLEGKVVGIVGLGNIGMEVARLCKASGMTVYGLDLVEKSENLDRFFPPGELANMLPQLSTLVLALPLTADSHRMLGKKELYLLPKGALFVNISRGSVVDESELINALRSEHLSGAVLDVFETEPLPVDSPLWDLDNVLLSPHSASTTDLENSRLTDLFCENLKRFINDEPLINLYDPIRKY